MHTLFLALVAYAGPNDHHWDQKRLDDPFWTNVAVPTARFSQRLQGVAYFALMPRGLRSDQVENIIGKHRVQGLGKLIGFAGTGDVYPRLGINVYYDRQGRLTGVILHSFSIK